MTKLPSPCISVCKYKRAGHCIACSMTKDQKSIFKRLKKEKHQQAFVDMLVHQQENMGKFTAWAPAYARKCSKKGVKPPVT
ncbi:DUF1289 domain-containing protein [Actibacterium lipolyticum]|uniref:DUF1289 domain-containing protein n=1 Tax=Actibacterium lipolyticum TaxID=1524263 RepID=A0A238KN03_9RHOB|nr:DUF1289 domain-containing protein [Actibacterium lipolyticum]SMX44194.1 hypothetical protein COL8621_02495 [Actibacterium lipolyticum]